MGKAVPLYKKKDGTVVYGNKPAPAPSSPKTFIRNPADVRAGIDASQIGMSTEAQRTATTAEIEEYQRTGTSPAQQRTAEATQQERLAKAQVQIEAESQKIAEAKTREEAQRRTVEQARRISQQYQVQEAGVIAGLSRGRVTREAEAELLKI